MGGKRFRDALSARQVEAVRKPGYYQDGGGLSLIVELTGTKRWLFRASIRGRQRATSLGHYPAVGLAEARAKRDEMLKAAREGRDVVAEVRVGRQRCTTFADEFSTFFEDKRNQLRNGKHAAQWVSTMDRYVLPVIGHRPIADVTPAEVVDILRPTGGVNRKPPRACFNACARCSTLRLYWNIATNPIPVSALSGSSANYGRTSGTIGRCRTTSCQPLWLACARSGRARAWHNVFSARTGMDDPHCGSIRRGAWSTVV